MNLAVTNPHTGLRSLLDGENNLRSTTITTLWKAAQQLCGSQYAKSHPKESTSNKPDDNHPKKAQKTTKTNNHSLKQTTLFEAATANPYKKTTLPSTPKTANSQSPRLPARKHRERYDFKIYIDPTATNPIQGFTSRIKEWFESIKSHDPTLAILPWFKFKGQRPILSPNDIPTEMKHLRNYFHRLSPKSGIIWTKVHLMMDQEPKDITSGPTTQMGWWYRDKEEGLYLRPLRDAEATQDLGILAYTCNFTNAAHTMDLINEALEELGCKFKIGGKLRPIKTFKITDQDRAKHRTQGGSWQTQYWFALHLISDISHQRSAVRYLYRLFNQKESMQPGNLRARFIPNEGTITMSSSASGKRFKMLQKHKAVIQSLHLIRTDSIISLDDLNDPTNFTLRHFLSTLTHSETGRPLYHSVDFSASFLDEGTNYVILTAFSKHLEEATALSTVLPALCQQKLHESTSEWFTYESLELCEGVNFDSETNKFSSHEDQLFDAMLEEDFGSSVQIQFDKLPDDLNKPKSKNPPRDDGSFISFGTMMDAKRTNQPTPTTGTDSLSSPTFQADSTNEQQAETLAATNAENEQLRQQIQSLLLEKAKWDATKTPSPSSSSDEARLQFLFRYL